MDPALFRQDLERTPESLRLLHESMADVNPWSEVIGEGSGRLILLGMGSSHFANSVLALHLHAAGVPAIATLASTDPLPEAHPDDVVIAVSASGGSAETIAAVRPYVGQCRTVALTNVLDAPIPALCDAQVPMLAGVEEGGVACRSFAHTLGLHLALIDLLTGSQRAPAALRGAVRATEDLLSREGSWLTPMSELLLGPDGTAVVAPARRLSSAQQSALMLREGPRLPAIACETGDWSHIDVYLTKTTDYRMLLLPGSSWEGQLLDWCRQRGSTVVAAGHDVADARYCLRYAGDDQDDVRLLAEPLIAELLAAAAWSAQS